MPERKPAARLAAAAGLLLTLAAVGFLAWTARKHWSALAAWEIRPWVLGLLAGVSVFYGVAMMLIAESWHWILRGLTRAPLSRVVTWPSYGLTQIGKYLPGNVFHYVGRHVWLARAGASHREVVTAAIWEVALLCLAACVTGAAILVFWPLKGVRVPKVVELGAPVGLLLAVAGFIGVLTARRFFGRLRPLVPRSGSLTLSLGILLVFFVCQGLALCALLPAVATPVQGGVAAIAAISWLVGYLTPGAPGGIGTREAVMVSLATPTVGPANALVLAALFRLVTTLGDLVCFAISTGIARRRPFRAVATAWSQPAPADKCEARRE